MHPFKHKIKDLEKRDSHLRILMSFVFLLFIVFITCLVFYSDIRHFYEEDIGHYSFNLLFIGFLGLSLLFLAYIITQEFSIKNLRMKLIEEQTTANALDEQLQGLKDLFEVSCVVNSKADLPTILDTVARDIMHCMQADESSLMFYNPKSEKLECLAAYGLDSDKIIGKELELDQSVSGWVVKNNKPLLLQEKVDPSQYKGYVEKNRNITSALCVPLRVKGLVKGVLNVNLINRQRKFNENDLHLLSAFAESVGLTIEKASLHQELKDRMSQLIQAEKFRAVEKLGSVLMHDLNNLLSLIIGRALLLLEQIRDTDLSKPVETIINVSTQAADIIQRLSPFGTPVPEKEFGNLDLNQVVEEAIEIIKPQWNEWVRLTGRKIKIEKQLSSLPPLFGNRADLREVIMSMLLNSIDALPKGGVISLSTWCGEGNIFLSVKDNGVGMGEEVKKKVFEPFFSTKPEKGNGLGMAVAYSIILQHKGNVVLESEESKGTTFTIRLPVSAVKDKEYLSKRESPIGNAHILLIGHDEALQGVLAEMLSSEGCEVKVASSVTEAIPFLKSEKYELIITDSAISDIRRWDFAGQVTEMNLRIPIILLAGWGHQILTKDVRDLGVEAVLSRPIRSESLKETIIRALRPKPIEEKVTARPFPDEKNAVAAS